MQSYKDLFRRLFYLRPVAQDSDSSKDPLQGLCHFISRDIHDSIAPGLLVIRMYADELRKNMQGEDSERAEILCRVTDDLFRNTRELIWVLHKAQNSLEDTVGYIVESFRSRMDAASLAGAVDCPQEYPDAVIPVPVIRCLLRGATEGIDFLLKNKKETGLDLSIDFDGGAIRIRLRDKNMESGSSKEDISRALKSIERKVSVLDGGCGIFSAGQSTTYWFSIPYIQYVCRFNSHGHALRGS